MSDIATRLRWVIEQKKLSQREFSKRAGLAPQYLNTLLKRLETGDGDVGVASMKALAEVGGVSLCWLITGHGQPDEAHPAGPVRPTLRDHPYWNRIVAILQMPPKFRDRTIERVGSIPMDVLPSIHEAILRDLAKTLNSYGGIDEMLEEPPTRVALSDKNESH